MYLRIKVKEQEKDKTQKKTLAHNTYSVYWLANMHLGSFYPAFTLS